MNVKTIVSTAWLSLLLVSAHARAQSATFVFTGRTPASPGSQIIGRDNSNLLGCPSPNIFSGSISAATGSTAISRPEFDLELTTWLTGTSYRSFAVGSAHATWPGPCTCCYAPVLFCRDTALLTMTAPAVVELASVITYTPAPNLPLYSDFRISGRLLDHAGGVLIEQTSTATQRLQLPAGFYRAGAYFNTPQQGPWSSFVSVDSTVRIVAPCTQIVEQPRTQTACPGADVELHFGVLGPGPWTFEWFQGGVSVAVQTSQLVQPPGIVTTSVLNRLSIAPGSFGTYVCVATTPNGLCTNVTSDPAVLTPAPSPPCAGACCSNVQGICTLPRPQGGCEAFQTFLPDQMCTPSSPCTPQVLACCYLNGTCCLTTMDDCGASGFWGFDGAACAPNPCLRVDPDAPGTCSGGGGDVSTVTIRLYGLCCNTQTGICTMIAPGQACPVDASGILGGTVCVPYACHEIAMSGACCLGSTCSLVPRAELCTGPFSKYTPGATSCSPPMGTPLPCCKADFNHADGTTVQDIFDFLTAWFAMDPRADFNAVNGVTVQDIFDFLAAWFAGC